MSGGLKLVLVVAGLTLACLLGCSRPPDDRTVRAIVGSLVKRAFEPQNGSVTVTIEKVEFGDSFTRTDTTGTKQTYFPCRATYSTVDAQGNATRDAVWTGDFAREGNKWIVVSHPSGIAPNKAPEPTPGAVTPRATEGASK
jgi:hypothetical protein